MRTVKRGPAYYRRPDADPWVWSWQAAIVDAAKLLALVLIFSALLLGCTFELLVLGQP